jgi:hypothetical protein
MSEHPQQPSPEEEDIQEEGGEITPSEESTADAPSGEDRAQDSEKEAFYHKLISRLKREMLRAQKENTDLKEKLTYSESVSSQMGQSALESFKANALTLMEKARTAKKHAHELSDIDGIITADEDLARAAAQLQWAQTVRVPQVPLPPEQEPAPSQEESETETHPATQAWIRQNPWINEQSPLFQGEKASAVVSYATALEQQWTAQGRGHEINTPSYFRELDAWVRYWDGQHGGHKTMKNVTTVASTRSAPTEGSSKKGDVLSDDEKEVCRMMNISEAGYLKQKKALALERN